MSLDLGVKRVGVIAQQLIEEMAMLATPAVDVSPLSRVARSEYIGSLRGEYGNELVSPHLFLQ